MGGLCNGLERHILYHGVCISMCSYLLPFLEHGFLHGANVDGPWGVVGDPLEGLDVGLEFFK